MAVVGDTEAEKIRDTIEEVLERGPVLQNHDRTANNPLDHLRVSLSR
jgi:hypothetical protein